MTARAFNAQAAVLGDRQHMELISNLQEQQAALFLFLPLRPATAPGCPIDTGLLPPLGLSVRVQPGESSPCLGLAELSHALGPCQDPGWTREAPQTRLALPISPSLPLWLLDKPGCSLLSISLLPTLGGVS